MALSQAFSKIPNGRTLQDFVAIYRKDGIKAGIKAIRETSPELLVPPTLDDLGVDKYNTHFGKPAGKEFTDLTNNFTLWFKRIRKFALDQPPVIKNPPTRNFFEEKCAEMQLLDPSIFKKVETLCQIVRPAAILNPDWFTDMMRDVTPKVEALIPLMESQQSEVNAHIAYLENEIDILTRYMLNIDWIWMSELMHSEPRYGPFILDKVYHNEYKKGRKKRSSRKGVRQGFRAFKGDVEGGLNHLQKTQVARPLYSSGSYDFGNPKERYMRVFTGIQY